jgi:hypothetical protein
VSIPCVLVLTENSLLSLALTNLINASDIGLVVFESTAKEFDDLLWEINTYSADVILVEKETTFAGENSLTKLLILYPRLLIVIVNEEDNWLHIYRRENLLMTSTEDLLGVLQTA